MYTPHVLMVIFGAGASFDSCPTYAPGEPVPPGMPGNYLLDRRPPLARELFQNRPLFIEALDLFPQCKAIVPRLRTPEVLTGNVSIEVLLQEIEEEAQTYRRGLQELAAVRCYLQRAINRCEQEWRGVTRGVTNYRRLLREIERMHKGSDPVALVTFNYDTLLEEALVALGRNFKNMESYTAKNELFRVFKLHGSINWAHEIETPVPRPNPAGTLLHCVEHAVELRLSDEFVLCDPSTMGTLGERAGFPAIAIPVEKKSAFECPRPMLDELTALLPDVKTIFAIGWRATEDHFLSLLKEHLKPDLYTSVVAANAKQAMEVLQRLHVVLPGNPPSISAEPGGFTDFMRTRRAEQILASRSDS